MVIEGDDWKHSKEPKAKAMTRAEAQVRADDLRITDRIDRQQWWKIVDQIGEPMREEFESLFV